MDLSMIGDQLDTFADFAKAIENVFGGFAKVFDTISGLATAGEKQEFANTSGFDALSSTDKAAK